MGVEIGSLWKKLGRRLGCNEPKIQEIDQAHRELSEKAYQMLLFWKRKRGSAATYQALCEALQHKLVQRQDLAETFCYVKGNNFPNYLPGMQRFSGFECTAWITD